MNKLIRFGLEIVKPIDDETTSKICELKEKNIYPPWFMKFISLYTIGDDMYKMEVFLDDSSGINCFSYFEVDIIGNLDIKRNIPILYNLEKIYEEYYNYDIFLKNENEKGFMRIGEFSSTNNYLLLGMFTNNLDEIWLLSKDNEYVKLSKNILQYFNRFRQYINYDYLIEKDIGLDDMYQNWGENFWRVKE